MNIIKIIRTIARIWAVLSIAFLLFMIGAHLIGTEDTLLNGFNTKKELLMFFCFPISTLIGLGMAFKWEMLGGFITVIGLISFHLIGQDYSLIPWIDGLAMPGLLFLILGFLGRNNSGIIVVN